MHQEDDPYEILQVSRNAEPEVVEAAYRRLARKYHPDVDPSPTATQKMQRINWAYEILRDPASRARYDRQVAWETSSGDSSYGRTSTQSGSPPPGPSYEAASESEPSQQRTSEEPVQAEVRREPSRLRSVVLGSLILAFYYLGAMSFGAFDLSRPTTLLWILVAGAFGGTALLSIAATAGWNPKLIRFRRVILMFVISSIPILAWIPCYLGGKAIARKTTKNLVERSSLFPLIAFGIGGTLLAVYSFGTALRPASPQTIEYAAYHDDQTGISFQRPTFLTPQSETDKQRTDLGTLFTVSVISAQSSNPSSYLVVRVIEDPTRDQMFPSLYPPSDDSLRILAAGDIANFQFSEEQIPKDELLTAASNAQIVRIGGYPAAEYSFKPKKTAIGDATVHGALVVTDRWDVSVIFMASVEPDAPGSLQESQADEIWERLKTSISFPN